MKALETRQLQKNLATYYHQINQVETNMVVAQMQKMLSTVDQMGLTGRCDVAFGAPRSTFRDPHPTYPLPTIPNIPAMVHDTLSKLHDTSFSKPRGVLLCDETTGANFCYDHNYAATIIMDAITPSNMPKEADMDAFDQDGELKTDGSVSLVDFFRQRSEWALELLIMGCFGLDAASTQRESGWGSISPTNSSACNIPNDSTSQMQPPTARFQQCKDHLLQRLPILLQAEQPTPTLVPGPAWEDQNLPQHQTRFCYYYDTLSHLTLLTTLPLYDTLVTLPASSP